MLVNADRFRELYVPGIRLVADDERFYQIPGVTGYAFSSYCRLAKEYAPYKYKIAYPVNVQISGRLDREGYKIRFDGEDNIRVVPISYLINLVFLKMDNIYIYNPNWWTKCRRSVHGMLLGTKWNIKELCVFTRSQYVEFIRAKIHRRKSRLNNSVYGIILNQYIPKGTINQFLSSKYGHMLGRALNEKEKASKPAYREVTIESKIIENPAVFKQHLLDILYPYPFDDLEIDKDYFSDPESKVYSYDTVIFMPRAYNRMLIDIPQTSLGYRINKTAKGKYHIGIQYYKTIDQALRAGRKNKAKMLRNIANAEKKRGLPKYIRDKMLEVADKCQRGEIVQWEPSKEVLQRERKDHRKRLAQKRKELSTANASPDI